DGIHPLPVGGPILGVFEDAAFPSETLNVAPGDSVIFYSDGVTDALERDGANAGIAELVATIAAHRADGPTEIVSRLLSVVRQTIGSAQAVDDATIAVVRLH